MQQDLDQLGRWAEEWLMEFNTKKCEVFHFGKSNKGRTFTVNSRALGNVVEQRDLGVWVYSSLKEASQVDRVVKKACGTLSFIGQNIEHSNCEVMLQLYKTLLKPHLEYCFKFWAPCHRKDVVKL